MSFELDVLVVNQNSPSPIPFPTLIEVINEVDDEMVLRLEKTWRFMSQTKGIWYSLVKSDNDIKNAYLLCSSDFEVDSEDLPTPFWIDDEDVIYNLTPLIIHGEFMDEFRRILKFLVEQSPSNTLLFLARYQGGDYEIIQGTLSLDKYIQLINDRKILFNVCYVITKD